MNTSAITPINANVTAVARKPPIAAIHAVGTPAHHPNPMLSPATHSPQWIRDIAPYQAGKPIAELARELNLTENSIVKLASNENPLGMSPAAQHAMFVASQQLARYPDANGFELKQAIGEQYDVPLDWITLGNGSNDILELAARSFLQPDSICVYSQYSFAVYALATQAVGAVHRVVPATADLGHDLPAMLAAITPETRLLFIANPNNPTGTFIPADALWAFLQQVPAHVLVVLDEAYNEYLPPELRYDSLAWVKALPNLLVSRTFSKAYGLAGLRLGYGIAQPAVTDLLNRVRQPFNTNTLAQAAAIASLRDVDFLQRSDALNRAGLAEIAAACQQLGLTYIPSFANFLLIKVADRVREKHPQETKAGQFVFNELLKQGVIVRPVDSYGLPDYIRVSIGLPQENEAFINALRRIILPL